MGEIITNTGMSQKALVAFLTNTITMVNGLKTLLNSIRNTLAGDSLMCAPGLAIGSDTSAVAHAALHYTINGNIYYVAADAVGTKPGNDVIPTGKYGAVAFDIDATGTIGVSEAAVNATGYNTALLAIAGIPALASDKVRLGTVTATKSDGNFTFGTTALNAANSTVAYTSATTALASVGSAISTADLALTGL